MKKTFIFLLFLIPMFFLSVPVQAEEYPAIMITSGYTAEGIYYEVYDEMPALVQRSGAGMNVSRTVIYYGKITPEREISWRETINGIQYTGILHLAKSDYDPVENKTTAVYRGTLTPVQ